MISSNLKTILVTGANKGIGFGILRGLIQKEKDYNFILTARNEQLGKESLKKLIEEFDNKKDKLFFHQLDITDSKSIMECADWIKSTFGKIDILVNNAAVATKGSNFDIDVYNFTFPTNVDGTINLTEKCLSDDLIKEDGRIIIVGSSIGNVGRLKNENLKNEFKNENLTVEGLFDLSNRFKQAILDDKVEENGWIKSAYMVSKMIINSYPRVLAKRKEIIDKNISVFACNPGWVRTDMAGPKALLSVEEGVVTPIYLIEQPDGINSQTQGKYFDECQIKSYFN